MSSRPPQLPRLRLLLLGILVWSCGVHFAYDVGSSDDLEGGPDAGEGVTTAPDAGSGLPDAGEDAPDGGCGALAACGGGCVDLQRSQANCGLCGHPCGSGASCTNGVCVCGSGLTECDGRCTAATCDVDHEFTRWPVSARAGFAGNEAIVFDRTTTLLWSRKAAGPRDAAAAAAYCDGLSLAGISGWRLPTMIELLSIVDYGQASPALDRTAFAEEAPGWYWTATTAGADRWAVDFVGGSSQVFTANEPFLVRCVH